VIALVLAPLILDQVNAVATNVNIDNYPGAKQIVNLVPLMYIVGTLFLSGFLVWRGVGAGRRKRGRWGGE